MVMWWWLMVSHLHTLKLNQKHLDAQQTKLNG